MGIFFLIFGILFVATPAYGDTLIRFTDGNAVVWDNVYVRGPEHCTRLDIGVFCVQSRDVAEMKTVVLGTRASEYGVSTLVADENTAARMKDLDTTLAQSDASDRALRAQKFQRDEQDAQVRRRLERDARDRQRNRKSDFGD